MAENLNKTILVTGATDGLGKRVSLDLASQGATLLLHGRNPVKGQSVLREIRKASGNQKIFYYNADLSSLAAVRRLSDEILAGHDRLDVLINNAALGAGNRESSRQLSEDGYELRFAVNYLAPYLLTRRLLSLLRRSAPARVVNVSSVGQQPLDFDDVMLENGYEGLRAYRQSKLAQVMDTLSLAEELKGSGVSVNCLHPASLMDTRMVFESDYFDGPRTRIEQGAQAVENLADSPDLANVTGEYFDGLNPSRANPQAYDPAARSRLRELSEKLVQPHDPTSR